MDYLEFIRSFLNIFGENIKGVLLVGSCAWSGKKKCRDFDLELILDGFSLLKSINIDQISYNEFSSALLRFVNNHLEKVPNRKNLAFILKISPSNQEISIRFV